MEKIKEPLPNAQTQRAYRVKITLFLFCIGLTVIGLSVSYQGFAALTRLKSVESERDRWQRADEVIQALGLREGAVVADFGSGVGYFTLKLADIVGPKGKVLPVDIRRGPLLFLQARAWWRRLHNIELNHSDPDNPHLPAGHLDAILVANTYHELVHPKLILACLYRSLVSGGRLVILDRGPAFVGQESRKVEVEHHELPQSIVEEEVSQAGFEIIRQQDRFTEEPGRGPWWLIIARKP
ncbi:MAG TPA: methyltransferase domain-containing protein [Terriglobia bacterium]|nr:methyltransferase domain-containing protein [Terriglobia bacterium]